MDNTAFFVKVLLGLSTVFCQSLAVAQTPTSFDLIPREIYRDNTDLIQKTYKALKIIKDSDEERGDEVSALEYMNPFVRIDPTSREIVSVNELKENSALLKRLEYYFIGNAHFIHLTKEDIVTFMEFNAAALREAGSIGLIDNIESYFDKNMNFSGSLKARVAELFKKLGISSTFDAHSYYRKMIELRINNASLSFLSTGTLSYLKKQLQEGLDVFDKGYLCEDLENEASEFYSKIFQAKKAADYLRLEVDLSELQIIDNNQDVSQRHKILAKFNGMYAAIYLQEVIVSNQCALKELRW